MSKLSIALLFVMLFSSVSLFGNNIFKNADSFHHALDSAKSKRKLLLSYAALSTTPCCIAMENATFNDRKVQNILQTSFYPIKVDLSTSNGKNWADNFQIASTPTLLFFDNDGTLLKQVENCISSTELIVILEEVLFFKKNGFWPMEAAHPVILTAYVPEDSASSSNAYNKLSNKKKESTTAQSGIIRVLLDQVLTNDDRYIRSIVERAKLNFPEHPLNIKLVKISQQTYFQVWIGSFEEPREAQDLLRTLKRQGFEKSQLKCTAK